MARQYVFIISERGKTLGVAKKVEARTVEDAYAQLAQRYHFPFEKYEVSRPAPLPKKNAQR